MSGQWLLTAVMVLLVMVMAACGSARRTEPITGSSPLASPSLLDGQKLFARHCDQCHPRGESGLAPALNNKPLPGFLMKFQVRHGLGAMPSFSEVDITDQELDELVAYLQALRHHR
jgi:mono/diheme cytochrome c family protein